MTGAIAGELRDTARTVWPAERFYWTVIDAPAGTRIRPGPLPIGLRPVFEEDVPEVPSEKGDVEDSETGPGLHAVCAAIVSGRVVVCAARASELRGVDAATMALCPAHVPDFVRDELTSSHGGPRGHALDTAAVAAIASSLNLLVGAMEPRSTTAARARRRGVMLLATLFCLGLGAIGLARRAASDARLAQAAAARADDAARELGQRLRAPVRVTPETLPGLLAVAQRSAEAAARIGTPTDASIALAGLLEHWPHGDGSNAAASAIGPPTPSWSSSVQSLAVGGGVGMVGGGDSIAITVIIEGDAAAFLRALTPPPGWTTDEPRLTSVGQPSVPDRSAAAGSAGAVANPAALTRIALTLRRTASSSQEAAGLMVGGAPR